MLKPFQLVRLTSPYAIRVFIGGRNLHFSPYATLISTGRYRSNRQPFVIVKRELNKSVQQYHASFWEPVQTEFEGGDGI